jgi:hypothetical protein
MLADPVRAAEMFETLAAETPSDPVPLCMVRRLRGPAADA